ncbi:hypothetical protein V8G54_002705 [Vigna mungo]|uniref:Transposase-associated domain-containing protein n=1 Tax=Vigna mungo TaxID=3915 RepID=A0AAQ3P8R8_VIGMU
MDRNWINLPRISAEYERGVEEFIQFAQRNEGRSDDEVKFRCPCVNCLNGRKLNATQIREHLICDGFLRCYTTWIWHGEEMHFPTDSQTENVTDSTMEEDRPDKDKLEDMIRDVGAENFAKAHVYETMSIDAETPLYVGATKFTRLSATDKSFTELLTLLNEMLPDGNTLPTRNYDAKKILFPMDMEYKRIHACPNDCILYRKEFEFLTKCPKCGLSRYKSKNNSEGNGHIEKNGFALKVVWYLPIVPRLKRLFANPKDAENLRWHADERKIDGLLRHPADSKQWKNIDQQFPEFGKECRNLRLGLATDGMNPFGNMSTNHSCWPVILIIYNLSPTLCMKRKYMMLFMMISGPKQPGNDIDVYLSPLVEDLKLLWVDGVEIFDAFASETFLMRAMLFCTINDFPAYGNLSGYSVKGRKACPICEENTAAHQLKHGRKTVYLRHRRFLKRNHPYRRLKKAFNGDQERDEAPNPLTGLQVLEKVNKIHHVFGKTSKKSYVTTPWKKKSIFFDLPYWSKLDVRHCIDVMHVEKNAQEKIPLSKDDPLASLHLLADILEDKPLEVEYDANVFGIGSEVPIYLHSQDVRELAVGTQELNISIIQLLVLSMQESYALWFCSFHRPPPTQLRQTRSYECGYYVMYWMAHIVRSHITRGWETRFKTTTLVPEKPLSFIRKAAAKGKTTAVVSPDCTSAASIAQTEFETNTQCGQGNWNRSNSHRSHGYDFVLRVSPSLCQGRKTMTGGNIVIKQGQLPCKVNYRPVDVSKNTSDVYRSQRWSKVAR